MTKHTSQAAILDAAARFYGEQIARGGLPMLAQVADKLAAILAQAQPQASAPPAADETAGE